MNTRQDLKSIFTEPTSLELLEEIEELILDTNKEVLAEKDTIVQKRWLKVLLECLENMHKYGKKFSYVPVYTGDFSHRPKDYDQRSEEDFSHRPPPQAVRALHIKSTPEEDFKINDSNFDSQIEDISKCFMDTLKGLNVIHDKLDLEKYNLSKRKLKEFSPEELELNLEQYLKKMEIQEKEHRRRRRIWDGELEQIKNMLELYNDSEE